MKRQDKLDIINKAILDVEICRCKFKYYESDVYYYPNAVNEKFILGQEEDDFLLNGYCIRKISDLKKVEIKDDKYNEINKINGLTNGVIMPNVDISSWETIFIDLKKRDKFVIIEDEKNDEFVIGVIEDVLNNKVMFKAFDADGNWEEGIWEIPFSSITTVTWNTRYTNTCEEYLMNKK